MRDFQQAADDVGTIAEAVEAVVTLLDRFHAKHGEELYERVAAAWPDASTLASTKPLHELEKKLTPPSD
jgi:hypothetical protein